MSTLYLKGIQQFGLGGIDFDSDLIKVLPMATSYTPNAGTHEFLSDISASAAAGFSAQTLANAAVNIDTGNARVEFDGDNVSESSVTGSTDKVAVYYDTTVAATSPLICCLDIVEGTLAPTAGTLTIQFNAQGLFAINAA